MTFARRANVPQAKERSDAAYTPCYVRCPALLVQIFQKSMDGLLEHMLFSWSQHTEFELVFYLFPARDDWVEELIKLWAMIMEFQVTQLMRNNIVNAFFRRSYQVCIEGHCAFIWKATPSFLHSLDGEFWLVNTEAIEFLPAAIHAFCKLKLCLFRIPLVQ